MSNYGNFVKLNDYNHNNAETWVNLNFVLSITPKIHGAIPVSIIIFSNGRDTIMTTQTPEEILGTGEII